MGCLVYDIKERKRNMMVPLHAARISDLGLGDRLHVQCVCQSLVISPPHSLLEGMALRPDYRIADLAPRLRCRKCGKVVVSVRSTKQFGGNNAAGK